MTALIVTVSLGEKEFMRVGYYVYNYYTDEELVEKPPSRPILEKITRNILTDKPRITTFDIFKKGQQTDKNFENIRQRLMLTQKNGGNAIQKSGPTKREREEEKFEEIVDSEQDDEGPGSIEKGSESNTQKI